MRYHEFKSPLYEATGFSVNTPTSTRSKDVADLQKALVALGYPLPRFGVDGIIGPETKGAIQKFQTAMKLPASGNADGETVEVLNNQLLAHPEISAKLTKSTDADVKQVASMQNIDVSKIQDPNFNKKLENIASDLGVQSSDIITIMKMESGLDPQAVNPYTRATGLIQFMPKTAARLGTSVEDLRQMSAVEQLDYVYKYFKLAGVKPGMGIGDLYMSVFMPAHVNKPDDFVLGALGSAVARQNPGLVGSDGQVTAGSVRAAIERRVA